MLILHGHTFSQHSRSCQALLELAGLPHEFRTVALEKGEHMSPAFISMNPNHQIPVLTDDDVVIYESNAILRYLCHKHDLTDWYPTDPATRGHVDQWLDWMQCKLRPQIAGLVFNKVFAGDRADQQAIATAEKALPGLFALLAQALEGREYIASDDHPTIADVVIAAQLSQLSLAKALPEDPTLNAYLMRIWNLEGFQKAWPLPDAS